MYLRAMKTKGGVRRRRGAHDEERASSIWMLQIGCLQGQRRVGVNSLSETQWCNEHLVNTLVIVKRNIKPPSRTMGDRGEGMVASTRKRWAVQPKACIEWTRLHIGGMGMEDSVMFSEGDGNSSRVGACGKPSADAGREITQMSRGSRLRHVVTKN